MKLKQKLYDLKNQRKGLLDEAKGILLKDGKTEAYTAKMDDVAKLNADIEATEALIAEEEKGMDPGENPTAISLKGGAISGAPESGLKKAIKALAAPFPQVKFLPTGGVDMSNIREFLDCDKIAAVGGSFMMKGSADDIRENCRTLSALLTDL